MATTQPQTPETFAQAAADRPDLAPTPFDFGRALAILKAGGYVARAGWNGKGMYLWLLPAAVVKREWIKDPHLLAVFGDRQELTCLGSIRMKTATGEVLTGWLASQTDMLAEDWVQVDGPTAGN